VIDLSLAAGGKLKVEEYLGKGDQKDIKLVDVEIISCRYNENSDKDHLYALRIGTFEELVF
jgi:hypothetical protein